MSPLRVPFGKVLLQVMAMLPVESFSCLVESSSEFHKCFLNWAKLKADAAIPNNQFKGYRPPKLKMKPEKGRDETERKSFCCSKVNNLMAHPIEGGDRRQQTLPTLKFLIT